MVIVILILLLLLLLLLILLLIIITIIIVIITVIIVIVIILILVIMLIAEKATLQCRAFAIELPSRGTSGTTIVWVHISETYSEVRQILEKITQDSNI